MPLNHTSQIIRSLHHPSSRHSAHLPNHTLPAISHKYHHPFPHHNQSHQHKAFARHNTKTMKSTASLRQTRIKHTFIPHAVNVPRMKKQCVQRRCSIQQQKMESNDCSEARLKLSKSSLRCLLRRLRAAENDVIRDKKLIAWYNQHKHSQDNKNTTLRITWPLFPNPQHFTPPSLVTAHV